MSDPLLVTAAQAAANAASDAYPRIVASLIRVTGDWTLAEDCAQEALALALSRWPGEGVPANPGGWLMTVARNRALDVLRRADVERRKLRELAALALTAATDQPPAEAVVDDRLRLIFTCCHPALSLEARVALTLRTICALPTADIARSFLVSGSTMTRRLTRAKAKIAGARIPYRVPGGGRRRRGGTHRSQRRTRASRRAVPPGRRPNAQCVGTPRAARPRRRDVATMFRPAVIGEAREPVARVADGFGAGRD